MKKRILTIFLVLAVVVGAIFAVNAATTETLTGNVVGGKTITTDTELDLNGFDIDTLNVNAGVTVTIKDSATSDYSSATEDDYGQIGTITGGGNVVAASGYLQNGTTTDVSFHAYTLEVSAVALRGDKIIENGSSIYYVTSLAGDEVVKSNIATFGVALRAGDGSSYFADGHKGGKTYTEYTADQWTTGQVQEFRSCDLLGIMKTSNSVDKNAANFGTWIHSVPYIKLTTGEMLQGEEKSYRLLDIVYKLDKAWMNAAADSPDSIGYTAKNALTTMQQTFKVFTRSEYSSSLPKINQIFGEGNTFTIRSASDLQAATSNPAGNFSLGLFDGVTDLDMSGVEWTPFTNFTGTFNGNGKTISNLTIDTQYNGAMGFAAINGGTIKNLHLRNVTVDANSNSASYVGTFAGVNTGTISGVTVTGTVSSDWDNAYVGVLAGKSTGTVTPDTTLTDTVSAYQLRNTNQGDTTYGLRTTATNYTTSGLCAIVGLYTEGDGVTTGLVANGSVSNASSVYWRDTSYSTERQSEELQQRRDIVVQETINSGTYRWSPAKTFTHYASASVHQKTYTAGTIYVGTPYDHHTTPFAQAMDFATLKLPGAYAYYEMDVSSVTSNWTNNYDNETCGIPLTDPYDGYTCYIGSDCSSACIAAWHQVSPIILSSKKNGGASFTYTQTLIPSQFGQWYYGVRPVGYEVIDSEMNTKMTYACGLGTSNAAVIHQDPYGIERDASGNHIYFPSSGYDVFTGQPDYAVNTYAIGTALYNKNNNAQAIYEAYAQTRRGDILVHGGPGAYGGHARLPAQDPIVIRNGNDVIDGKKSFFLINEQGDGLYEFDYTRSSWRINHKYTFAQLAYLLGDSDYVTYTGSKGVYLPITIDALNKESVKLGGVASGGSYAYAPENTKINGTARIMSAKLIIKNSAGNVVYTKTFYQSGVNGSVWDVGYWRCSPGYVPLYTEFFLKDTSYQNGLAAGTYTYDYEVRTYGNNEPVMLSSVLKDGSTDNGGGTTNYTFTVS